MSAFNIIISRLAQTRRFGLWMLLLIPLQLSLPNWAYAEFSLRGTVLAAHPDMRDPRFSETVILIIEHNQRGAYGLVVNRPTPIDLNEVSPELVTNPSQNYVLHYGGPVQPQALSILLFAQNPPAGMREVLPDFYFTRDSLTFDYIVEQTPAMSDLRISFGHASWISEQLEGEIEDGAWLIVPGDVQQILQTEPDRIWGEIIDHGGLGDESDAPAGANVI